MKADPKRDMQEQTTAAAAAAAAAAASDTGGMKAVAARLRAPGCKVAVLVGAGMSVGAGIPDFRSPGGMYDTLRPELLTATEAQRLAMRQDPTQVVSWDLFAHNAFPYLEVRRPFILGIHEGRWKPTLSHFFVSELDRRGMLTRLYSQNIDGLEHRTDVAKDKMVACHGSLGEVSCEQCEAAVDTEWFVGELRSKIKEIYGVDDTAPAQSSPILCPSCGEPGVKPSTVLYGRSLPNAFFEAMDHDFPDQVNLLMVVGTSLTVSPANSVPRRVGPETARVVVNMEPVGAELGIEYDNGARRDFFLPGPCDASLARLVHELGWAEAFEQYRGRMHESGFAALQAAAAAAGH